jgi:3-oxoacyl-[acyl-carrier protein] reductase
MDNMDLKLKGKVVLITGANNPYGIGAATAYKFANEGSKVVLVYKKIVREYNPENAMENGLDKYFKLNSEDASSVEEVLCKITDDYFILERDITDENTTKEIFDEIENRFGIVNILVNNAAVGDEYGQDTIYSITKEIIEHTFDVNVKSTLLMIREFVKRNKDYGRIINLSTDASQRFAGQITYGASKATIEALTRSIAIEIGKKGITINTVSPGPTQTGYIDKELEQKVVQDIPLSRLGKPDDIANAIVFLSSEQASWITGQIIQVSGGHYI